MNGQRKRRRKGDGGLFQTTVNGEPGWAATWHDSQGHLRRAYGATPEAALARKAKRIQIAQTQIPEKTPSRRKVGTRENPSVEQFMHLWLETDTGLEESSRATYRKNIRKWVLPYLGKRAVRGLKKSDIVELQAKQNGGGIGPSAREHVWKSLKVMLNTAKQMGYLKANPMDDFKNPRATNRRAEKIETHIDSHTQKAMGIVAWILKEDCPYRAYAPLVMALNLGLRRGEALGLTQEALDYSSRSLHVRATLAQVTGGGYRLKPGTKSGKSRTIRLPQTHFLVLAETARVHQQDAETMPIIDKNGDVIGSGHLLITHPNGQHLSYNDWREKWIEIQQAYKMWRYNDDAPLTEDERILPHEMRHISISMMGAQGETLQTLMDTFGHLTPEMTEHYHHQLESQREQIAERWEENIQSTAKAIDHIATETHKASQPINTESEELPKPAKSFD